MTTILYDSGVMSIGGKRSRVIVSQTARGVEVRSDSLYGDVEPRIQVYLDGNYPALPDDWQAIINSEYGTTAGKWWLNALGGYTPDRTINPYARSLGRSGGSVTSPAKGAASRANGRQGGRPRKQQA